MEPSKNKNTSKIIIASLILVVLVAVGVWVSLKVAEASPDTYSSKLVAYYRALERAETNLTMVAPGFVDTTGVVLGDQYEIYRLEMREIAESNQMELDYILINEENNTRTAYVKRALFSKSLYARILAINVIQRGVLIKK